MRLTKRIIALVLVITSSFALVGYKFPQYESENVTYPYVRYIVPENEGFKSYMDYQTITNTYSRQYALQQMCTTNYRGIRIIDGRYCIALGTLFNAKVGQLVTITLENGAVIPCVVGDIKADKDTDELNVTTVANGCLSEFIVERSHLPYEVNISGNIGDMYTNWASPVYSIDVYPTYMVLN